MAFNWEAGTGFVGRQDFTVVERAGIAEAMMMHLLREKGLHLTRTTRRDLGTIAAKIGVPIEVLISYIRPFWEQMFEEAILGTVSEEQLPESCKVTEL